MPGPQDKVVTVQAATAVITSIQFTRQGASIIATAYGQVNNSDGTVDASPVSWTLAGAADTTVRNFMDGAALTRWRTQFGIEAP